MSKIPQFPRSLCVLLGLLGLAAYVFMGIIDYSYGEMTAVSSEGKQFQPIIMIIVSVGGFVTIAGAGAAFRSRHMVVALFLLIASLGCMAYSGLNGVGFFAGETITKTRAVEEQRRAEQSAASLANDRSIEMRKQALDWMTKTRVRNSKDQERLEDKVIDLATKPVEVRVARTTVDVADTRSEVMKKLFGFEVETAQITNAAWLVSILVAFKLLGPSLAFGLWPRVVLTPRRQTEIDGFPNGNMPNAESGVKSVSIDDALQDLRLSFPKKTHPITTGFLKEQWGISRQAVHYRLDCWEAKKLIVTKKSGDGERYVYSVSPVLVANNQASVA